MRDYNWLESVKKYLQNFKSEEIILIGDDLFTLEIYETIESLKQYKISYVVSNNGRLFSGKNIEIKTEDEFKDISINKESQFFLVAKLIFHKEAYEMLVKKGLLVNLNFAIMGIGGYTKPIDAIDSLLGFSRIEDDIPGFAIFGDKDTAEFSMVILGNSTSDPSTGMIKSWSEMLFDTLSNKGINVVLYNGATTGYCSTQEFLKFNRDVIELCPDLVISFGGYNDIEGTSSVEQYPFLHKYSQKFYRFLLDNPRLAPDSMYMRSVQQVSHGNKTKEEDCDIWINNMQKIKAICDLNDIQFLAFFQPMLETENVNTNIITERIIQDFYRLSDVSKEEVHKKTEEYSKKIRSRIKDFDYIKDCTGWFKNKTNVFYDTCHYTEFGNAVISNNILIEILPIILDRGICDGKKIN